MKHILTSCGMVLTFCETRQLRTFRTYISIYLTINLIINSYYPNCAGVNRVSKPGIFPPLAHLNLGFSHVSAL